MKHEKNNISFWNTLRGTINTEKGGWIIGEAVHNHGYSQLDDLVGSASFFQVLLLNVTGKLPKKQLAEWFEALFICLSWPDSRIWCNQIGSLAGTMKASPVAACSAGILASDSRMYGPGTIVAGVSFITSALQQVGNGTSVTHLLENFAKDCHGKSPLPMGYARPIACGDERITAMEGVSTTLGFERGKHLELAYRIEKIMQDNYGEGINLLGYTVAFLSDQGFSATDQTRLLSSMVHSGVQACYAEAADKPPESFFPLQCNDIDYQGTPPRVVPEK
jgi:hypothetical protein